jgi:Carboxypeptidase regulatory-like domain
MIRTAKAVSAGLCFLLFSTIAFGQGGVATGDLHVTVKDPKGSLVANATVTVRDKAKGLERSATSDSQGYSARLLPPGIYSVTVQAPGFASVENTDVIITVGGLAELQVALSLATATQVLTVTSQAELVETSRSSTTDTIGLTLRQRILCTLTRSRRILLSSMILAVALRSAWLTTTTAGVT